MSADDHSSQFQSVEDIEKQENIENMQFVPITKKGLLTQEEKNLPDLNSERSGCKKSVKSEMRIES